MPVPNITYIAVLPFSRTEAGDFLAEAAIKVRSAEQASAIAARKGRPRARRSGVQQDSDDPQLGEWRDAVILGRYGDVLNDLAPYMSG
jgi:hypothetical protein